MANGVNKVLLLGRVGKDPEIKNTQGGLQIASFSLATSESWKDKATGEKVTRTEWHNVSAFGKLAEIIGNLVKKGTLVYVEGKLNTQKWQDKQSGQNRQSIKIIADNLQLLGGNERAAQQPASAPSRSNSNNSDDFFDDSIPF